MSAKRKKKRRKIAKNANFDKLGAPKVRQCCRTCRFFEIEFIEDEEDRYSWCVRYPPTYIGPDAAHFETLKGVTPYEADYWVTPYVGVGHWCGEWRPWK